MVENGKDISAVVGVFQSKIVGEPIRLVIDISGVEDDIGVLGDVEQLLEDYLTVRLGRCLLCCQKHRYHARLSIIIQWVSVEVALGLLEEAVKDIISRESDLADTTKSVLDSIVGGAV